MTAVAEGVNRNQALDTVLRILRGAVAAKASDIHFKAEQQPRVRIQGQLCPLDHPPLTEQTVQTAVGALASLAHIAAHRVAEKQVDFSCEVPDVGRFRVHVYRQSNSVAAALRHIPSDIPDFAALRLPPVVKRIAASERGLVLITGAAGNGKSTTVAAMLEHINQKYPRHVVTIEEPVEWVFSDHVASFSQREVGRDVDSFQQGLEGVLREDADVLFVGEIRTRVEFEIALSAAESGRLVVSTLHSSDVERAISRMVNFYPLECHDAARHRIADVIAGVISQRLIPRKQGTDKILATEVLTRSPTAIECVREPSRSRGLSVALEAGTTDHGSHSFDQTLASLVADHAISMDTAKANARSASELVRAVKPMR